MTSAMTRRDAVKILAVAGTGGLLHSRPGQAATSITMMHESSFIKAYDEYFQKKIIPAYEKAAGVKVVYEIVSVGSTLTRNTTAAETGSGPDLTLMALNWPFLFDDKLVDVSDIAEEAGKANGGWHDAAKELAIVNGKWKAVPFGNIGQLMNYRIDWFKAVGYDKFPDTWDELLEAGAKLKKKGQPFGMELGHGFGDNHGWLYPLLWSYGGAEVLPDGKTIVIDSDETARAVDFCRKFYQATMQEDVLGWTDPSNNKAWMSEQISCTNNAESILYVAKRDFPDIAQVTGQAMNPQGPKGRFHILNPWSHSIFTHSKDLQASKDFLRWLMKPENISGWYDAAESYYAPFLHAYDNAPLWTREPRNLPYRESLATSRPLGWPAPAGRQQSESVAKYVVVDMFAQACAGKSTKDVIADAKSKLQQIYKS
jgi:multiple sugar transport system substrate-binding protein